MNRLRVLLPVLAALALLAGCQSGTDGKEYVSGDRQVVEYPASERKSVDPIEGDTLQGEPVSLRTLAKGRPVVINVWAPWCAPCRAESKDLAAAAKQLGDRAAFLGVSIRSSSKANPIAFERRYDVPYPSLWDPDGRALLALPPGVAQAIPSTVVLDGHGRVAASIAGPIPSTRTLVALVRDAG